MQTQHKVGPRHGDVWFCSAASTHFPVHTHPGAELNVVMSGELHYQVDGFFRKVAAGQVLVLPPEVPHQLTSASSDAGFWVIECGPRRPRICATAWLEKAMVHTTSLDWIRAVVAPARKLWLRPDGARSKQLWTALEELFAAGPPPARLEPQKIVLHPAVIRARSVCESAGDLKLGVQAIARQAGLSSSRLSHLFQEQLGLSPLQYQNYCRIQRFISSYAEDDENLMRSALCSGFGSYPQFHRTFQQVCGSPPAAHLEKLARDAWMNARRTLPQLPV